MIDLDIFQNLWISKFKLENHIIHSILFPKLEVFLHFSILYFGRHY